MRQYKEYDNRERRTAMKQKRIRKVFERRNNLTSEAEYNWIRYRHGIIEYLTENRERLL